MFTAVGMFVPRQYSGDDNDASDLDQTPDPDMDVASQAQSALENKQIRNALSSLPGAQRQIIEMAYFHGMTRQEIAEATGEALGTIHTRARLALQKLREELEKAEDSKDSMENHIEDLLPFYALDALTEEEREQVEAYLATHPEARAQLEEMSQAVSVLPQGIPPVEPEASDKICPAGARRCG